MNLASWKAESGVFRKVGRCVILQNKNLGTLLTEKLEMQRAIASAVLRNGANVLLLMHIYKSVRRVE